MLNFAFHMHVFLTNPTFELYGIIRSTNESFIQSKYLGSLWPNFPEGENSSNQVEEKISDSHTHKFMQTINVLKNENLCDRLARFSVLSHGHFRV